MKFLTPSILAISMAIGVAGTAVAPQAAVAAEKKAKVAPLKLSEPARKALVEVEAAVKAKDYETAKAKIEAAKAVATSPDDRFVIAGQEFNIGLALKDQKIQYVALDAIVASGRADPANLPKLNFALGQFALVAGDYAKAEAALDEAIRLEPSGDHYVWAAEAKYRSKKMAEAAVLVVKGVEADIAAGKVPEEQWVKKGMAFSYNAKDSASLQKLSTVWLSSYPKQDNWREVIEIYRQTHTLDTDTHLDFMRLQRVAGALRGEKDYVELAESTYLRFPNEAKTVLEQGIAAGVLNKAKSRATSDLLALASGKVAADKASLSKSVPNIRLAVANATAYASYGDHASAIELYRKALAMPGVDTNMVNIRLGASLVAAGQVDAARQAFAAVTGPRADLAAFWLLFLDHPPVAAVAG